MLLDLAADACGERVALGPRTGGTTFAALRDRVRLRAAALLEAAAAGIGRVALTSAGQAPPAAPGKVPPAAPCQVAFLGETGPAFVETLFAAAWAGLPFAPLNYRLKPAELGELLDRLGGCVVVHDQALAGKAASAAGDRHILLAAATLAPEPAGDYPLDPEAVAVLLHTSGTTAAPKAVVLRHRQLFAYATGTGELGGAGADQAVLMAVPPYHIAGVASALSGTWAGRRCVHLPSFDPVAWLRLARAEAVTHAFLVPTMLARIVEALERGQAAPVTLALLSYGGAACPPSLLERAIGAFPPSVGFVNAFGLTETSSTVAVLGPDDHRAALASRDPAVRARLASAGLPRPGVEVAVLGQGGRTLPAGAAGEIAIRGPQVSGEYRQGGSALDPNGWYRTGDLGYLDEGGYLFVTGRRDDLIIRGGENVSPLEIEEVLAAHPAVREAAVVGVPDAEWGQRIGAAVVLDRQVADAELLAWARARLASYKCPVLLVRVEALPRTDTGKLRRREVATLLGAPHTTGREA
jgi:acyl-CoA synthetase (AMP-forming)/AMP-acid ligase II